jgi:hypothetical protein
VRESVNGQPQGPRENGQGGHTKSSLDGDAAGSRGTQAPPGDAPPGGRYKWLALSNTTLGMLAATVNASAASTWTR